MGELAIGDVGAAAPAGESIGRAVFAAWLETLSPAQRRGVEAVFLVRGLAPALPAGSEAELLTLAPDAGSVAGALEQELGARVLAPPLVVVPAGDIYYSGGGATYRRVSSPELFARLGLARSSLVPVDRLELEVGTPWPTGSTTSSAFTETGRTVAASGSTVAAVALALYAVRVLGATV